MAGRVAYFGNNGLSIQSGGEIVTDNKGLATGRMIMKCKPEAWQDMPEIGAQHPYASFCTMERRSVRFTPGFWTILGDFVGCEKEVTDPTYDFNPGTSNEPIETINNFVSAIAGKPSAPLNGAIWRDENGDVTTDNKRGIFDRFKIHKDDGTQNPWAGCEEYLAASNTYFSKNWVQKSKPSGASRPLKVVSSPPGGKAPSFTAANYNWLEFPVAYSVRGLVYECSQRWLLSGPRGWNRVIYDGTGTP